MEPRKIIGTVDTSEFLVALSASIGFLLALTFAQIPWTVVGALLLGGVIAAPIAAYIVRILPARILGTAVGGVILITNMKTFLGGRGHQRPAHYPDLRRDRGRLDRRSRILDPGQPSGGGNRRRR